MTGRRASCGFSLVELMVSLTLGLALLGGVVAIVSNTSRSHSELERNSRQVENGRYALQTLADDIRHAGFYDQFYSYTTPTTLPLPCTAGVTPAIVAQLKTDMGLPVQGAAGASSAPSPFTSTCLPNYQPNTDVLVIRRVSTVPTVTGATSISQITGALTANQIYVQAHWDAVKFDIGTNASGFTFKKKDLTTFSDVREYLVRVYFISSCSKCSGPSTDTIPTLYRAEMKAGTWNFLPIAEGIENMQLRYGLDADGNGRPDDSGLVASPSSVTDWANVITVEVNLLARNLEPSVNYTDNKTYTLGDVTVTAPGDSYRRRTLTSTVVAANPAALREQ